MMLTKVVRDLWTEPQRFSFMKDLELMWLRELESQGKAPIGSYEKALVRSRAISVVDLQTRSAVREGITGHDIAAFVDVMQDLCEEKMIHYGLTSSDVVDTVNGVRFYKTFKALEIYARGTMNEWQFGLFNDAFSAVRVGKLSGAVGTYAADGLSPEAEANVLCSLGLEPETASGQVVGRDRYAYVVSACAILYCSLVGKSHPAMSAYVSAVLENVALHHERDISHSSVERVALPRVMELMAEAIEHKMAAMSKTRQLKKAPKEEKNDEKA